MLIKTGCENLDEMLGGGIPSQTLSCWFGTKQIGKTLLMLQLASKFSIEEDSKVLYLDTERFFSPSEVVSERYFSFLGERFGGEPDIDVMSIDDAFTLCSKFGRKLFLEVKKRNEDSSGKAVSDVELIQPPVDSEIGQLIQDKNYGMLILDSFSAPIDNLISARKQNFTARSNITKQLIGAMRVIAGETEIPIIHTTHESSDPSSRYDTGSPVLGSTYGYGVKTVVQIRKSRTKDKRKFELARAPGIRETEVEPVWLKIEKDVGFVDIEED